MLGGGEQPVEVDLEHPVQGRAVRSEESPIAAGGQLPSSSDGSCRRPEEPAGEPVRPGGERAPFVKPSARGSFNGITGSHTRRHMLRAVYEGVAYGIRDCLDSIPTEVKTVRMAGGGANSAVWCQIFADVLGRTIIVPAGTEFGAKGAAIVAGVGAGVFSSYAEGADATVNIVRTYEPNLDNTKVYDRYFPIYRSIRTAMPPIWDELQAATRADEQ